MSTVPRVLYYIILYTIYSYRRPGINQISLQRPYILYIYIQSYTAGCSVFLVR